MSDSLRSKAEAIAKDLFWIVDDENVGIIHKHLLDLEKTWESSRLLGDGSEETAKPKIPVGLREMVISDEAYDQIVGILERGQKSIVEPAPMPDYTQEPRPTPDQFSSYRSVPTTISAVRFTDESKDRIFKSLTGQHAVGYQNGKPILRVTTVHGETAFVRLGDWIVEDSVLGTYYPVKHDVFERKYLQPTARTLTPEQVERAKEVVARHDRSVLHERKITVTEIKAVTLLREIIENE